MSLYKGNNLISGAMPNSANQSLSNLDSAGQDIIDGKVDLDYSNADYQPVNKAGDTMTGNLIIQKATGGAEVKLRHPKFTKGTNPSGNIYWEYKAEDNNINPAEWYTNRVSNLVTTVSSSGTVDVAMIAYKNDPNSSASASIRATITSAGVASCSFPNTTCCDGQWVSKYLSMESTTYAKGTTAKKFSLSSYLPNDDKEYLVLGHWEGNTADAYLQIRFTSDIISTYTLICRVAANTNGGSSFVFPIGTDRYLNRTAVNGSTSKATGNCYLTLTGYRRCGTNA